MICEGKTAIVTGAAGSGMGRSIALTLAREGAKVVVNYRTSKRNAKEIVDQIRRKGGDAIKVQADIFEAKDCRRLTEEAIRSFGRIDICIVGPGGGWHPEPIHEMDSRTALSDIHQEIAPLFYLMPLLLPRMYTQRWGRIIGIALHPTMLPPAYPYNVGKAARREALLLAREQLWFKEVTVNIIAPGPVEEIKSLEEAVEQCYHGERWRSRRTISPQDIAEGVVFLCSEAGRFITGCVLPYQPPG